MKKLILYMGVLFCLSSEASDMGPLGNFIAKRFPGNPNAACYSKADFSDVEQTAQRVVYSIGRSYIVATEESCRAALIPNDFLENCLNFAGSSCAAENRRKVMGSVDSLALSDNFCETADKNFSQVLDFGGGCVFCIFSSELEKALSSPAVGRYLKDLKSALSSQGKMNLWGFTLNHPVVGGDPELAIALLAVLFQDTTQPPRHLQGRFRGHPNTQLVIGVIKKMKSKTKAGELDLYPHGLRTRLSSGPYHFYVPALLAVKMKNIGNSSRESQVAAILYPSLMVRDYEAMTARVKKNNADEEPWLKTRNMSDYFLGVKGAEFAIIGEKSLEEESKQWADFDDAIHLESAHSNSLIRSALKKYKKIEAE